MNNIIELKDVKIEGSNADREKLLRYIADFCKSGKPDGCWRVVSVPGVCLSGVVDGIRANDIIIEINGDFIEIYDCRTYERYSICVRGIDGTLDFNGFSTLAQEILSGRS